MKRLLHRDAGQTPSAWGGRAKVSLGAALPSTHPVLGEGRSSPRPADPGRARPLPSSLSRARYARRRRGPALRPRVRGGEKAFPQVCAPAPLLPEVGVNSAEKTQIKAALRYLTTPQKSRKGLSHPATALPGPGAGHTGGSGHPVPAVVSHPDTREASGLRAPGTDGAGRGTVSCAFPRERRSLQRSETAKTAAPGTGASEARGCPRLRGHRWANVPAAAPALRGARVGCSPRRGSRGRPGASLPRAIARSPRSAHLQSGHRETPETRSHPVPCAGHS